MKKPFALICAAFLLSCGNSFATDAPHFTFPVACVLGENCIIQNYVDHDPGPGWRDFTCGPMSYDGHDGTDIRIPSLAAQRNGVGVLSVADGTVLRTRMDLPDRPTLDEGPESDPRACGNGLVIDHGNGWQSQYCHMAQGSLLVRAGDRVKAGQRLGLIGFSGRASFPHLHLTVRHDGKIIDPFAPDLALDQCGASTVSNLFDGVGKTTPYLDRFFLNVGFADGPVTSDDVEEGRLDQRAPKRSSDALVVYARSVGLVAGDALAMTLIGADGQMLVQHVFDPLDRSKAQMTQFIGKKKPEAGWAPGTYAAVISILRQGKTLAEKRIFVRI